MADSRRFSLNAQLDIEQILQEAQHRWLRPAEICEILQNYQKFRIAPEPPNRPPSGSLFLFNRKVLRYFRKDGHSWRKKKDGKTVKEAHERLKSGSIDVLHCYYAHGEENENFQRRCYWMLEEELSHIVLVHYREVKGSRTNYNRIRDAGEANHTFPETEDVPNSEVDSSASLKIPSQDYQVNAQVTESASLISAQASEYEDVESACNSQTSSGFRSLIEAQQPLIQNIDDGFAAPYYSVSSSSSYPGQIFGATITSTSLGEGDKYVTGGAGYVPDRPLDLPSWNDILENSSASYQSIELQPSFTTVPSDAMSVIQVQGNEMLSQVTRGGLGLRQEFGSDGGRLEEWQCRETDSSHVSNWTANQQLQMGSTLRPTTSLNEATRVGLPGSLELYAAAAGQLTRPMQDPQARVIGAEGETSLKEESGEYPVAEGKADYSSLKQPILNGLKEGLKKLDSFDRWMSKELGDVDDTHVQSSSGAYWEAVGNEDGVDDSDIGPEAPLDSFVMGPSLARDQYFSFTDFSPGWAYAETETKILITGQFLKSQQEVDNCKWACMFGELEVPAEVIAAGTLCCHTPVHKVGRVPFYITLFNRLACSEVREFEFQVMDSQEEDFADASNCPARESLLLMRFERLLFVGSSNSPTSVPSDANQIYSKISSLLIEDKNEWKQMLKFSSEEGSSTEEIKDQLLQKLLKEKLHYWLLRKIADGGKGPGVLDEGGQGVLHLSAALDYDWAIPPTIAAGVSINFRDSSGWTALHWAASYGRERTVCSLISLGAAAGALTDPTPKYPSGRTSADLASNNGHKGIAGLLAESDLSSHLGSLELKDKRDGESSGLTSVQKISERTATPISDGDSPLKDSLAAVRNATQAAARIYQVFRVQSFQRKKLNKFGNQSFGMSDERALSHLSLKTNRARQHDVPHAAAIQIQNKYRSWKGRKYFLLVRQHVIKIQAHFRGHQVRKNNKIIWSVGILEKVILRWRRKGSGLRGFRPEMVNESPTVQEESSKEDDYDVLKQGRMQTEKRLQKALARVKSMVQYPEARDQYRRLLNVVSEMQENKAVYDKVLNSSDEGADLDENLVDLQALLDDDTFMAS